MLWDFGLQENRKNSGMLPVNDASDVIRVGDEYIAELLDFTCMKDMREEPVLVFKWSSDDTSEQSGGNRHDLLAAPEDMVDTWRPARFIADISSAKSLWAIEIGGGTISYD